MPVVGVTEATALLLAALVLATSLLRLAVFDRIIYLALAVGLGLALSATLGTQAFRRPRAGTWEELKRTLALLGFAVLLVPVVVYIASRFGLTGA